ncbi:MAG: hypothetical protein SGILL_008692 [Bacillariaceae sp.]
MCPDKKCNHVLTPEEVDKLSKRMGGGNRIKRKADEFPDPTSVPHAKLEPLFPDDEKNDVWTVRGCFKIIPFIFDVTSTMTIHRNAQNELTIFNALRCNEELEQETLKLGTIAHVVKLGQFHGDADAYYVRAPQFNSPKLWTLPQGSVAEGMKADGILTPEAAELPITGSNIYNLECHPFPEGLMTVPCQSSQGSSKLLVACDSLVHVSDLSVIGYSTRFIFYLMGLNMKSENGVPKPAPMWMKQTVGAVGVDRVRKWYQDIMQLEWNHFVGAHGGSAKDVDHDAVMQAVEESLQGK